jgi:hypothetical protein
MPLPEAVSNRRIGELFVERGLVSQSQLLVALELQQETGQQLGQVLVERFGVERSELAKVVAEHWARLGEAEEQASTRASDSWRQLGEILVERGFVSREQLDQALDRQSQTGERLGEALVGQGLLTKFELAGSLAEQASVVGDPAAKPEGEPAPVVPIRVPDEDTESDPVDDEESETPPEVAATAAEEAEPPLADEVEATGPTVTLVPDLEDADEAEAAELAVAQELEPRELEPTEAEPSVAADDEEHAVAAYVAFASTARGYRLVEVEDADLPEPGQHVDVPGLGELVVLRLGVSPLPLDERPCVFLEPPVPVAHAG